MPINKSNCFDKNITESQALYAFTLSEVLITIGIIGVIAAMVLPPLVNNINDSQYKSAWKKAYSLLGQAQEQIMQDAGGDFANQCTSDFDNVCLRNLFAAKMKTVKVCDGGVSQKCTVDDSKFMNGASVTSLYNVNINGNWPGLVFADGMSVKFRGHYADCHESEADVITAFFACGWMQVDVNGSKSPNVAGRDIYFVGIGKTKLTPFGAQGDGDIKFPTAADAISDCSKTGSGMACSAIYLYN